MAITSIFSKDSTPGLVLSWHFNWKHNLLIATVFCCLGLPTLIVGLSTYSSEALPISLISIGGVFVAISILFYYWTWYYYAPSNKQLLSLTSKTIFNQKYKDTEVFFHSIYHGLVLAFVVDKDFRYVDDAQHQRRNISGFLVFSNRDTKTTQKLLQKYFKRMLKKKNRFRNHVIYDFYRPRHLNIANKQMLSFYVFPNLVFKSLVTINQKDFNKINISTTYRSAFDLEIKYVFQENNLIPNKDEYLKFKQYLIKNNFIVSYYDASIVSWEKK